MSRTGLLSVLIIRPGEQGRKRKDGTDFPRPVHAPDVAHHKAWTIETPNLLCVRTARAVIMPDAGGG